MKKYSFSIIVPIYNAETYLKECVMSVLRQSYSLFELILVDDGSTDSSWQIMRKLKESDKKHIKIYHQENGGQISARFRGIDKANFEYCLFLDADDFLENNALEIINSSLNLKEVDVLIFNAYRFYKDKNDKKLFWPEYKNKVWFGGKDAVSSIRHELLKSQRFNNICLKCFKTEVLKGSERLNSDYYKIRHEEDMVMQLPYLDKSESVMYIPQELYYYRDNPFSISYSYDNNWYESEILKSKLLEKYSKKWGLDASHKLCNSRFLVNVINGLVQFWITEERSFTDLKDLINTISKNQYFKKIYDSDANILPRSYKFFLHLVYRRKYRLVYSILSFKYKNITNKSFDSIKSSL